MQQVKLSTDTDMVVLTQTELDELRKQSQQAVEESLIGARWTMADVIKRLSGYRREELITRVLIPKKDELEQLGAILSWPIGRSGRYLFKATVMAQWMEDNLDRISHGGWD